MAAATPATRGGESVLESVREPHVGSEEVFRGFPGLLVGFPEFGVHVVFEEVSYLADGGVDVDAGDRVFAAERDDVGGAVVCRFQVELVVDGRAGVGVSLDFEVVVFVPNTVADDGIGVAERFLVGLVGLRGGETGVPLDVAVTVVAVVFAGYRRGYNPDTLVGPIVTTAGDIFGVAFLLLAVRTVLYAAGVG